MSISFGALERVINLLVLVTSSVSVCYIGPMDFFSFSQHPGDHSGSLVAARTNFSDEKRERKTNVDDDWV
jgi:hypothetical protein